MKPLLNQKGVTLLELVFYITLSSIVFVVAAAILATQLDAFANITRRQGALADIRYGLDHISQELIRVEHTQLATTITRMGSSQIDFTDRDGVVTNFRQGSNGPEQAIYRGNDILVSPVESFTLQYYDAAGTLIEPANDLDAATIQTIRRIKITIYSQEQAEEGRLEVTNTITPRGLIYENYQ